MAPKKRKRSGEKRALTFKKSHSAPLLLLQNEKEGAIMEGKAVPPPPSQPIFLPKGKTMVNTELFSDAVRREKAKCEEKFSPYLDLRLVSSTVTPDVTFAILVHKPKAPAPVKLGTHGWHTRGRFLRGCGRASCADE